jgi:hypothetical protein
MSGHPQPDGIQRPATSLDARTGAAIAALEDRVLLFGGYDPSTGAGFNDVASFDLGENLVKYGEVFANAPRTV